MVQIEYEDGSKQTGIQEKVVRVLWEEGRTKEFYQSLEDLIELSIAEHGHAWCMDVEEEREKISRMIVKLLEKVQQ